MKEDDARKEDDTVEVGNTTRCGEETGESGNGGSGGVFVPDADVAGEEQSTSGPSERKGEA